MIDEEKLNNIPFLSSILNKQISNDKTRASKSDIKNKIENELIHKYSDELLNNYNDKINSFEKVSKDLLKMGFPIKEISHSFLAYRYDTADQAIELLSEIKGKKNHKFIQSDNNLCFICGERPEKHINYNIRNEESGSVNLIKDEENSNSKDDSGSEIFLNSKNEFKEKLDSIKRKNSLEQNIGNNSILIDLTNEESSLKLLNNAQENDNMCGICFDEIINSFSLKCKHKFCKECVIEYLKEEIKNSRVLKLKCPFKNCEILFDEKDLTQLLNEEYMYKYHKFLQREKIKKDPSLVVCPIVNCDGYAKKPIELEIYSNNSVTSDINSTNLNNNQLNKEDLNILIKPNLHKKEVEMKEIVTNINNEILIEPKEDYNQINNNNIPISGNTQKQQKKIKLICNKGHPFCSICNEAWHGDTQCNEDQEIKQFATYSGFIVKKCPKCKVWTEKNKGCNHMKCKICSYNWCWLCENECPEDHFQKKNTPCYGKQFDNDSSEAYLLIERLFNYPPLILVMFFPFIMSFLIYKVVLDEIMRNGEREEGRINKFAVWCTASFITFLVYVILLLSNGILLITMLANGSDREIQNVTYKKFSTYTKNIIFLVFYISGGPIITSIWYISVKIYSAYLIFTA